ncbi:MAG TPA: ribonuclease H-like domain-containing protein, partial [Candidatus Sumerlaeota bacterium]|nr:ribonuclease H-like domain-containing protein [Candidatus Sumerlaeota bacterium]
PPPDWPPREDTTELEFFPCPRVKLTEAAPGVEIRNENGERPCYLVNTPVSQISDEMAALSARFHAHLLDPEAPLHHWLPLRHSTIPFEPEHLLFLDLETTGLSNSPLFLVGAMVWENGDLTVKQYFARDFSEEAAAIAHFARLAENRSFLVTFNGISFDVPYLYLRAATFGLPRAPFATHLDLLHLGRRVWGRRFGNCKLQTFEHHVCGRQRTGDIPGREIPGAYRAFVQTGNAWQVASILEHNRLDLITLADLMTRLPFPQPQTPSNR